MSKSRTAATAGRAASKSKQADQDQSKDTSGRATRETIESIVVAVILAFLFRAFVAEAFVIPTGSMAPTLQGRHMDVTCEKCDFQYRTGASIENDGGGQVEKTTCPICRYTMTLYKHQNPNQRSFNGDRILVSKFTYEFSDPKRWDVIVFKYRGNAKQNYIKRLVGLPNETLQIRHGDIYYRKDKENEGSFRIARKPPHKLKAMMHLVDDTRYRAQELIDVGWPPRWQDWRTPDAPSWRQGVGGHGFETTGVPDQTAWLRYRHVVPVGGEWEEIADDSIPERLQQQAVRGQLITDYYAYNDGVEDPPKLSDQYRMKALGLHWVGDLAVECDVQVRGDSGHLLLDLVEGGVHYTCRIDVATGEAVLSMDDGQKNFVSDDGVESQHPTATTKVRGSGSYRLRLSNCDDKLLLWVNDRVVKFDGPTTYMPGPNVRPAWSEDDAGDLEPAGVGAQGVELAVSRLRLHRDVYYVATSYKTKTDNDYEERYDESYILDVLTTPKLWSNTPLFDARREGKDVQFTMGDDQFFPLGDNSPQSRDARLWSHVNHFNWDAEPPEPCVDRELLTGKALLIYWPHSWRRPIPFLPNIKRMGLIR